MENLNRRWGYLTGPTAVNFASVSVGLTRLDQDRFEVTYDPGTTQLGAHLQGRLLFVKKTRDPGDTQVVAPGGYSRPGCG